MKKSLAVIMLSLLITACSSNGALTSSQNSVQSNPQSAFQTTSPETFSTTNQTPTITSAAAPSSTQASATLADKALTSDDVVKALKEAKIEIGKTVTYNEETDPNNLLGRPNQYTSKTNFRLKGDEVFEGEDPENTIEVFESEADAKNRKQYVENVTKGFSPLQQYIYHKGKYVLRIHHQTTPSRAKKIEEAFLHIVK